MAKHVMTGHIDYDVDITVHGKVAPEIYDTMVCCSELGYRRTGTVLLYSHTNRDVYLDPRIYIKWYTLYHQGSRITADAVLRKMKVSFNTSTETVWSQMGRTTLFNIHQLHYLDTDGSFEFKISMPLPPNMLNRMLTGFQEYLRFWDKVGDSDERWLKGRDSVSMLTGTFHFYRPTEVSF